MDHPTIAETIEFAMRLHRYQTDKAGVPYISHPLSVMRRSNPDCWHVAVLHDTMEDCGVTPEQLRDAGYFEVEIQAIRLLTRGTEDTYTEFIERIATSGNPMAVIVKIADLQDNLDPSRPSVGICDLRGRYIAALERLQAVRSAWSV